MVDGNMDDITVAEDLDTRVEDFAKTTGLYGRLEGSFGEGWDGEKATEAISGLLFYLLMFLEASPADESSGAIDWAIDFLQGD